MTDSTGGVKVVYYDTGNSSNKERRRNSLFGRQRASFKKSSSKRFSVKLSTEQNHQTDEARFYGPYAHMRKKLDYTYHNYYRKERQWLHDSIIEEYLNHNYSPERDNNVPNTTANDFATSTANTTANSDQPWFIYTAGAKGAGKRHVINKLMKEGKLPLLSVVFIDAVEIRQSLPEYSSYVEKNPKLVSKRMNKEAGYISELLTLVALQAGKNVVLDGKLKHTEWYIKMFRWLQKEFQSLKLALIHVDAPVDLIMQRGKARALETGMDVSLEEVEEVLESLPISIEVVKPEVDYFCQVYNGEQIDIRGDTWENFSATFQQEFSGGPILESVPFHTSTATSSSGTEVCNTACRKFVHRMFCVLSSTEENHKSDDMNFYGTFAHIRETLDYNYHHNYTFERQKYQDAIVSYFLNAAFITDKDGHICSTPTEPWIVFTAGAMGAGKSYTMRHLMEYDRFPLAAFVNVDPDEIRRHLPEYQIYVDQCPELAGELTRKEAGYISELMTLAAIQAGKNVMVDGSLRDAVWYQTYFERLRRDFPYLRLAIIHVTAPREAVFQRAADRAKTTGRVVPKEMLILALEQVPRSIATLRPLVDYFVELNNAPDADDIELVTEGETWEHFQSNWIQFCAWLPNTRKKVTRF